MSNEGRGEEVVIYYFDGRDAEILESAAQVNFRENACPIAIADDRPVTPKNRHWRSRKEVQDDE